MISVLVTGKNSQLASCIRDIEKNYTNISCTYYDSESLDITNEFKVQDTFSENCFDYCINCAAYTAVDKAEIEKSKAEAINIKGVLNLAKVCKAHQTTLIHISTDFVFDGKKKMPYTELDQTNPINHYGITKLKGELEISKTIDNYFIIRTSWLYSEYGNNFVKTLLKLFKTESEIKIVDDQIGSPTYSGNLAQFILELINSQKKYYGIYNFSDTGEVSWYNFAITISKILNIQKPIFAISSKDFNATAQRPNYSVLDNSKTQKKYNFPTVNWEQSLNKAIKNVMTEDLKTTAIRAAIDAGKEIMAVYNSEIKVELKYDNSPLTEADERANNVINSFLETTPYPIISEENKQINFEDRKTWATCWVVDPLDGTKEFIKRNGEFTVNIALVENGKPTLGVIYAPFLKVLYVGEVKKKEPFKVFVDYSKDFTIEDVKKNFKPIGPDNSFKNSVKVVGSRSHMNKETEEFIEKLNKTGYDTSIVSKGSSLKFCLVAEGAANVYPRFAPTMEWDTAAGQAICNAVGIDVISQETNKPLEYNKENLLNPWFLVGNHENL